MTINFPSNPAQGQTYTFNNNLWVYHITYPGFGYFNGIWNLENVRFVNRYDGKNPSEKAHILSDNLDEGKGMYVTINSCKFYSSVLRGINIWHDIASVNDNVLEVVGTSIANSDIIFIKWFYFISFR